LADPVDPDHRKLALSVDYSSLDKDYGEDEDNRSEDALNTIELM